MGDAENAVPSSKKRAAGRQITQLDPEPDDDVPESEMGTFKRASDEVLSARRIVKVRRHQSASESSSNPFAGIRLVPTDTSAKTNSGSLQSGNCRGKEAVEEQNGSNEKCENSGKSKGTECGAAEELVASNEKYDKSEEGKGTECRASENELNGAEQANKIADAVNASATKLGDNGESDAGEEAPQGECVKEVTNGRKKTEMKAQPETDKDKLKSEEESGEKADAVVGEGTDKAEKQANELRSTTNPAQEVSSFQQLSSSKNAFTGLSGIGFPTSSFSFGTITEGSEFGESAGLAFGSKENTPFQSFGFGSSNNGSSHFLSGTGAQDNSKNGGGGTTPSMQEVPIETGEENEQVVFNADAILYEYLDGGWKERGKGELKLNVPVSGDGKARLVMRARGNYRLILNASIYPDMALTNMDKKGITFACVNSSGEGKDGLTTLALKFKDSIILEEFRGAVAVQKGKKPTELKTPENSPKASDG